MGNYDAYDQTRNSLFSSSVPNGFVRATYETNAFVPGNGIILTRFFIQDCRILLAGHGNCRDFTDDPNAGYKIEIAWNTDTGKVAFTASNSCVDFRCHNADTIGKGNDLTIKGARGSTLYENSGGGIDFTYNGTNSIVNIGSIHGRAKIDIKSNGDVYTQIDGTAYPSVEIYQYRSGRPTRNLGRDQQSYTYKNSWIGGQIGPLLGLNSGIDRRIAFYNGEQTFNPNVKYLTGW